MFIVEEKDMMDYTEEIYGDLSQYEKSTLDELHEINLFLNIVTAFYFLFHNQIRILPSLYTSII